MAELQTVAAVLDLLKLTWEVGRFLKRVSKADKTAQEICDRIGRLEGVLEGIRAILKSREEQQWPSDNERQVEERICGSVLSCKPLLAEIQSKTGASGPPGAKNLSKTPWDRVKIAWNSSSIHRINADIEGRIRILGIDLAVLQLHEQGRTNTNIESHHTEVLQVLSHLGEQVALGNKFTSQMMQTAMRHESSYPEAARDLPDTSEETLSCLTECIRAAEDVHERFTEQYSSQHEPDDRSERLRRAVGENDDVSPRATVAPSIAIATPTTSSPSIFSQSAESHQETTISEPDDVNHGGEKETWPLEILDWHIDAYAERAILEREAQRFSQAEVNLTQAIRNSEIREDRYKVPFAERIQMQEDLAMLFQKQQKWAEAVALIHKLRREQPPASRSDQNEGQTDIPDARQNFLLASIYYDRHICNTGAALNNATNDIEKAEQHALRAFNALWESARGAERSSEEKSLYTSCVQQLVGILEASEKPVEAIQMRKILEIGPVNTADSLRRISTARSRQQVDDVVVDKHEILLKAVQSGDLEETHDLLMSKDVDLDRPYKDGKTILTHAVEQSNEPIVSKLLDPEFGAQVNALNQRGLTALHYAAIAGLYDMVHCLLEHDADVNIKDRRSETAVVKAVQAGHVTTVEVFFDSDHQTLQTRGGDEYSLLHYAVHTSETAMANVLLDLAPDLKDSLDRSGKTALHHCAESEKLDMAMALLQHKHRSDVNAIDSVSRTPLYLAASKPSTPQRVRMVRCLLENGAEIDERRAPPRMRDYIDLKTTRQRERALSRTSMSTVGTVGTASTGVSRISRAIGRISSR